MHPEAQDSCHKLPTLQCERELFMVSGMPVCCGLLHISSACLWKDSPLCRSDARSLQQAWTQLLHSTEFLCRIQSLMQAVRAYLSLCSSKTEARLDTLVVLNLNADCHC